MILAHIKQSLRETFPVRASEWALALMLLNWSLILVLNPDLFADGASYRPLAAMMKQDTWALLCLVAGAGRLIFLAINGAWRRSPHLRALGAFIACLFWFQITVGFAQAGTWSTGLAVYPVLLLLDSYNVMRAVTDAAASDQRHQERARNGNKH
ncbi:hypothetical protein [Nitratireductor basaltis]|uniref:Transmembrane protein n=1 Tax=Nitratireductor basaltis TaxID=472175 RepID=A0A084UDI3_9HYPH|nr:hypothetical protein [Nitratireductor basaltis]KFB11019.1 hypothetical protein EL18_02061 [Nitratireductor basaltis]